MSVFGDVVSVVVVERSFSSQKLLSTALSCVPVLVVSVAPLNSVVASSPLSSVPVNSVPVSSLPVRRSPLSSVPVSSVPVAISPVCVEVAQNIFENSIGYMVFRMKNVANPNAAKSTVKSKIFIPV